MTAVAQSLARNWVGWYTRWVGTEAAERRRAEIESDLWDQLADARERAVPPSAVALSITRRVVAGIPADLHWTHTQRLAERGRPAGRKARPMDSLRRFAATWWWTAAAAGVAGSYGWIAISNLQMPGIPYLEGTIQATLLALMVLAGVVLQRRLPRVAGALVIAGALSGVALWWSPVIQAMAAAACVGAVIVAMRATKGTLARVWTGLALTIVGLAPIAFIAAGSPRQFSVTHALVLLATAAGIGLLLAAGRRREVVTA